MTRIVKKHRDIITGALATAVIVGLVAVGTVWSIEHRPENLTPPTRPPSAENIALTEAGQQLFMGAGICSVCHTIDGISQGQMGPPLTHIGSDAGSRINGYKAETYIRQSILESGAHTATPAKSLAYNYPPGLMESIRAVNARLTESDVQALVAFLMQQK